MRPPATPVLLGVLRRAVLFADLAGYSAMMSRDERGTLEFMVVCGSLVDELAARYGGKLVQTTGDGYLVLFEQTLGAVEFGVELHRLVSKRQEGRAERARFRVGIHFGDVHNMGGSIYGHAVNVAARLQAEAAPGTCVLSQRAYDDVRLLCSHPFESIGKPPLKNISEQMELYRIPGDDRTTAAPATATSTITVVGTVSLRTARSELTFSATSKVSGLFGYLALAEGSRQSYDKVASLLWPDTPDRAARAFGESRRNLVRRLAADHAALLVTGGGHIGLNELYFDTDLQLIEKDLQRGRVPALLVDVPGWPEKILEGFDAISPVLAGWIKVVRASWRTRILGALSDLVARVPAAADGCRDAARAILAIDPGNEAAVAALMKHHTLRHNRAAAVEEYARLERYLSARHALVPSAAVREALRAARRDSAASTPPTDMPAGAPARLLRIAVAPFRGASDADAHLIEGFRSELLANLARFREWSVTDEESPRLGPHPDPSRQESGHYIVDGEYLETPESPRLRVRLRDRHSRRVVWSDDLSINLEDWAALQRNIVGRIAAHLETYISADRLHLMVRGDGHDAMSHDGWLRAEQIFSRWTPEAADEAETILRGIIERDQGFAPAYSSLAGFRNVQHVVRPGLRRDAAGARQAHAFAQRAVEIDALDARNHLSLAWTAALTDAFDRAAIHLDLAASLNPNSASTLVSCAMAYAFIGQHYRAETLVSHVLRISPMLSDYQWCYVASVHFLSGRHEEALSAARLSGDRIVDNPGWTAATLARLGRLDEARRDFDRLIDAVRPIWAGDGPPTAEAVFDWFTGAYPLRRPTDFDALREALGAAMRGK